jgi:hypothetical protein
MNFDSDLDHLFADLGIHRIGQVPGKNTATINIDHSPLNT